MVQERMQEDMNHLPDMLLTHKNTQILHTVQSFFCLFFFNSYSSYKNYQRLGMNLLLHHEC